MSTPKAFVGATLYTISGEVLVDGVFLVRDGKFEAVGKRSEVVIPDGAEVIDVSGKAIMPGIVDTHSHLGVYARPSVEANSDGNEMTGPMQSFVRATDSIWPGDPGFKMARAGGITTINIMPGSGNVMGGQTAYVKNRGRTVEEMLIKGDQHFRYGMKMANGENPKRIYGKRNETPSTRMGIAGLQRNRFLKAQEYMKKWEMYEKNLAKDPDAEKPDRDLDLEPVVEILQKKRPVHFHSHRADDIMTAMRLADEFGFRLILHHVTEAYKVVDEIAKRKVPCSLILLESPGGKHEAVNLTFENGGLLEKAGVKTCFHSDDPVIDSRFLIRCAALAVREGMSEPEALKALTLNAAEMIDLGDRIGSIEPGKDADFIVLSGHPFSVYTRVLQTYIEGENIFDFSDPEDRIYATGGFGVKERYPSLEVEE
jgi:imidazolonepropionase-like amidohydrolase